ncbi:MAG: hypothetical protein PHF63_13445 [Herbinix sp.]|nr:hypothetical protein [Herbinix sp.]
MVSHRKRNIIITFVLIVTLIGVIVPIRVSGEVKPITEVEDKLEGITKEEKAVLEELFSINQKIEELELEEEKINGEINTLQQQINELTGEIEAKQKDYDFQLDILEQVLVDYQRGGPSTYFEILLSAEDLSTFLKSINVIKDISHNMNDLLASLEDGKKALQTEKESLDLKAVELEQKKTELAQNLSNNQELQEDKKTYLAALQENKAYYKEQLGNLETMWEDCQSLFPKLADEITETINEGYFAWDDLNMDLGFLNMNGYIEEDTFNGILEENTKISKTKFLFKENKVILEVPEEHLVLTGNFIIAGKSAIQFEVLEGTFYDMPLEKASIEELFENGPMLIDFNLISEGIITVDFTLNKVESQEAKLAFDISPNW